MTTLKSYPVGIQTFERVRTEGKLYIDKTEITIKGYDSKYHAYLLGIPNREVRMFFTGYFAKISA